MAHLSNFFFFFLQMARDFNFASFVRQLIAIRAALDRWRRLFLGGGRSFETRTGPLGRPVAFAKGDTARRRPDHAIPGRLGRFARLTELTGQRRVPIAVLKRDTCK